MTQLLPLLQNIKLTGDQNISIYLIFLSTVTDKEITIENFPLSNFTNKLLQQFRELGSKWKFENDILKIKTPATPLSIEKPIEVENELLFCLFMSWFAVSQSLNTIKIDPLIHSTSFLPLKPFLNWSTQKTNSQSSLYIAQNFNSESEELFKIKPHFLTKTCLLFSHLLLIKPLQLPHGDWGENQFETLLDHFRLPIIYNKNESEEETANELEKRLLKLQKTKKKKENLRLLLNKETRFPQKPFISIPNDLNLASFYTIMAILTPKAKIKLSNICFNGSRNFFFSALKRMGAKIQIKKQSKNNDFIAQIQVEYSPLVGRKFTLDSVKKMTQQIPFLILAGAFAKGKTIIRNIEFLRQFNTDLLHSMILSFKKMGIDVGEIEDGLIIKGQRELKPITYSSSPHISINMTYWLISLINKDKFSNENYQYILDNYPTINTNN